MLPKCNEINELPNDIIIQNACIFDYIALQKLLKKASNNFRENINVNIFQNAYILLKLNKIYDAYIALEEISNKLKDKDNLLFVISEFNRKQIGRIINQYDYSSVIQEKYGEYEFKRVNNSIKQININYLIDNYLTEEEQKIIKKQLNREKLSTYKNKIIKLNDDIDKKNIYIPGIREYHIDLFKEYVLNYIFMDQDNAYRELYYYAIKVNLLDLKNIKENNNQDTIIQNASFFERAKERNLNYIDIYLMIEYLTLNQLNEVFDIADINIIPITKIQNIFCAYENLIKSIIKFNFHNNYKFKEYIRKFFIIFSKIEITKAEFINILELYMQFLEKYNIYFNDTDLYRYLMDFIIKQFNDLDKRKNVDVLILEKLLLRIYEKTIVHIDERPFFIRNSLNRVVRNLSNIINFLDKKYTLPVENIIQNDDINYITNFYIPLYSLLNKNLKRQVRKLVIKHLNTDFNSELFYLASLNKIIRTNEQYENNLLDKTITQIKLYYKLKENPKTEIHSGKIWKILPEQEKNIADNSISIISDLINFDIIKNKQKYFGILKYTEFKSTRYLAFVCDMQKFDYNQFEVSFLHFLTPAKTRELKKIINSSKSIKQIIKDKIMDKINIKNKYNDVYMKNKILFILFNEPYSKLLN